MSAEPASTPTRRLHRPLRLAQLPAETRSRPTPVRRPPVSSRPARSAQAPVVHQEWSCWPPARSTRSRGASSAPAPACPRRAPGAARAGTAAPGVVPGPSSTESASASSAAIAPAGRRRAGGPRPRTDRDGPPPPLAELLEQPPAGLDLGRADARSPVLTSSRPCMVRPSACTHGSGLAAVRPGWRPARRPVAERAAASSPAITATGCSPAGEPACSSQRRRCRLPVALGHHVDPSTEVPGDHRARRGRYLAGQRERLPGQRGRLRVLAAQRPEPAERRHQAYRGVRVTGVDRPAQRRRTGCRARRAAAASHASWSARRSHGSAVSAARRSTAACASRTRPLRRPRRAARRRTPGSSPASGSAPSLARDGVSSDLSTSDGEQVRARPRRTEPPAHRSPRQGRAAGEHRRAAGPAGRSALVEQVPAPVDHRAQRLVPGQRGPAAAGEQPEPVVEPGGDLRRRGSVRSRAAASSMRQRHPVQPAADLHHRGHGGRVDREAGAHRGGPVGEQPHGRVAQRLVGAASGGGQPSGATGQQRLAGDRRAAPGWWPAPAAPGSAPAASSASCGGGVDQVLAVVQDQQRPPVGAGASTQPVGGRRRRGAALQQRRLAQAERRRAPRRAASSASAHRGQLDQPDAVGARCAPPRPAPPRWPAGSCPRRRARPGSPAGRPPAARRPRGARRPGRRSWSARRAGWSGRVPARAAGGARLAAQHREVHGLQRRGGVDAELVGQRAAAPLVGGERVGLRGRPRPAPASAGRASALAQRVVGDQVLELGDGVAGVAPGPARRRAAPRRRPAAARSSRAASGGANGGRAGRPAPGRATARAPRRSSRPRAGSGAPRAPAPGAASRSNRPASTASAGDGRAGSRCDGPTQRRPGSARRSRETSACSALPGRRAGRRPRSRRSARRGRRPGRARRPAGSAAPGPAVRRRPPAARRRRARRPGRAAGCGRAPRHGPARRCQAAVRRSSRSDPVPGSSVNSPEASTRV